MRWNGGAFVPERPENGAKRKSVSPLGTAADKPVELARRPLKTPFVEPGANDSNAPRKEMMAGLPSKGINKRFDPTHIG
jgi:hypothetical protein